MMDVEQLSSSFLLSVVVLLLVFSCKPVQGTLVVNVTQSSYQAEENHNITLEWTFTTSSDFSISSLIVFCELINDHPVRNLFHLHGGVEVPESQDQQFVGRVQLDRDVLREGRVRLHVSRLRTEDSGRYRCKVRMKNELGAADSWLSVIGDLQVVGAPQPVVAVAGSDVILSCHVEPPLSVAGLTVEWSKPDFKPSWQEYVHLYRDTREDVDMKILTYKHRTALFKDDLTRGNISLKITNVTFEDSGRYKCFIPKLKTQKRHQFAMVRLVVVGGAPVRNRVLTGVVVGVLVATMLAVGVAIYLRRKSQQREVMKAPVI